MACCPSESVGYLKADHVDAGSVSAVDEISYYQVGSGRNGLLLLPDIWGWNGGRTRALADDFAQKGLNVWVPKLLPAFEGGTDGDALPPEFDLGKRGAEVGPLFNGDWHREKVTPKIVTVAKAMKKAGVAKMGVLGICYGAWVGIDVAKEVKLVGCASAHPSINLEEKACSGDVIPLAEGCRCPWAFFPAGDAASGDPEMYDADGKLFKALEAKFPGKNVTKRYAAMSHGFVTRGDAAKPEVATAIQECVADILEFFVKRGLLRRAEAGLPPVPVKLKKPKFGKVAKLQPEAGGLNLMLKSVKCDEVEAGKTWEAVLGDASGVVTFSLKSAEHAALCKEGSSVRVQNARVLMVKGHIRVIIDKWAVMKAADEPVDFEPKLDKDVSQTEYERA